MEPPERLNAKGISDHSPTQVLLSWSLMPSEQTLPLPRECFSHPRFEERLKATVAQAKLDELSVYIRVDVHETLIRK